MAAQDIDLHLIELKYAHTRVLDRKAVFALMRSLDRYGQITPVTVIPNASSLILIDGYVRVAALAKLGRDTVLGVVQGISEQAALLHVLAREARRPFHPLEQAGLILELKDRFGLSLRSIATGLGQDTSWVKRRLDLLQSLPENVLDLVRAGHICLWSASRVLAPLARANHEHALALSQYLITHPLSTRELQRFFKAYQKATRKAREAMIHNPGLFLKARDHQDELKSLQGPEKAWFSDMKMVCSIVRRLGPQTSAVFACLGDSERVRFQGLLVQAEQLIDQLAKEADKGINHALATGTGSHPPDARQEGFHQGHLQADGAQPEHCAQGAQR